MHDVGLARFVSHQSHVVLRHSQEQPLHFSPLSIGQGSVALSDFGQQLHPAQSVEPQMFPVQTVVESLSVKVGRRVVPLGSA
jgi:hypothetical protein